MLCIGLVIAAFFFNISLILFKTGSMSPTIPQGSMSVVQRISADEIRVGDVVMTRLRETPQLCSTKIPTRERCSL
ncbi:S26 family signal peptidase [Rhodococcus rhodochrous]|nr:S26 family signal peptidase [Rhodococcus rhodochrous]